MTLRVSLHGGDGPFDLEVHDIASWLAKLYAGELKPESHVRTIADHGSQVIRVGSIARAWAHGR